jgi:hypothetical protein
MIKMVIRKEDLFKILYYMLWVIFNMAFFFLKQTELQYMVNTSSLYNDICLLVGVSLILLFFLTRTFTVKELIIYVCVAILIGTSLVTLHDKYLMVALGFILLGRTIDAEELVRVDIAVKIFVLGTVLFMCFIGYLPNYTKLINGSYKQGFGFSHPNGLAGITFIILLEWMYIRYKKIKIWEYVLIIVFASAVWNVAASRTNAYTFILIFVCLILSKVFPKLFKSKIVINFLALLPLIITIVSFGLIRLYEKGNAYVLAINEILTRRITQASLLLDRYGVSMFGQYVNTRGTRSVDYSSDALFSVDMLYIAVPIKYGVFILALLVIGYFFFIKRSAAKGNYKLVLMATYFIIMGFAETYLYRLQYNFTLALLLTYVNERSYLKGVTVGERKKQYKKELHVSDGL